MNRSVDPISHIQLKNPFQPKQYIDDKETILDIKAETEKGELIDIEMQIVWDKHMPLRLVYYHGGMIRDALKEGDRYDKMKPTMLRVSEICG